MNASRAQFDEEKNIDRFEPDGFHRKEIAGQDLILVMVHQVSPTNGSVANRRWFDPVSIENISDG